MRDRFAFLILSIFFFETLHGSFIDQGTLCSTIHNDSLTVSSLCGSGYSCKDPYPICCPENGGKASICCEEACCLTTIPDCGIICPNDRCCTEGICCGLFCCLESLCCNGKCCSSGEVCVDGTCCPATLWCVTECCPITQPCRLGQCQNPTLENCLTCDTCETACNEKCEGEIETFSCNLLNGIPDPICLCQDASNGESKQPFDKSIWFIVVVITVGIIVIGLIAIVVWKMTHRRQNQNISETTPLFQPQ